MTESELPLRVLGSLPIFDGMNEVERQHLVDIADLANFRDGEVVLRQGEISQVLWIVLDGKCEVVRMTQDTPPREVKLAELIPYEHFGEMSFFHTAPHSASVRAIGPLRLLKIERRDYDILINERRLAAYKMSYNIVRELSDRLRRMDKWITDLMDEKPVEQQPSEWSNFRDKMFGKLNL